MLLRGSRRKKSTFKCYSETNAVSYFGVPLKIPCAGEVSGIEGERERGEISFPSRSPPAPIDQPCLTGEEYYDVRWFGDIQTGNDSSGSGTTERIENGCKDDYYNFQRLGPKSETAEDIFTHLK